MRIAQLSTNVESVPPTGYGGTELVVHLLTEELIKRGHKVTLFATGDSQTKAKLVSVCDQPLRLDKRYSASSWPAFDIRLLIELEKRQDEFDVVHNHLGWQALPTLDRLGIPTVTTNHNLIKGYCQDIFLHYKHLPYVALSHAYKRLNYPDDLNYVEVVYNGINCDAYHKESDPHDETAREFLLFLGRLGRDKGTAKALEIAQRLKLPLKLAGKIDDRDQTYFETDIKPHLSAPGVEFVGEAHFAQKLDLLKHAIAVVYPVQFDEPFGLVMAESMAAGTPVMALNRGAVSEIVGDGQTGIVCDSVDEMVDRYGELKGISARACRRRARSQFDQAAMVDAYEALYRKLLAGNRVLV